MTDEEFEKIWADCKKRDERLEEEWDALPEEEKERRYLEFVSNPSYERIYGYRMERHRGADGKWIYETVSEFDDDYC